MTDVKRPVLSLRKPVVVEVVERPRCDLTIREIMDSEKFPAGISLLVAKRRRFEAVDALASPFLCCDPELLLWRYKWWTACLRYLHLKRLEAKELRKLAKRQVSV